MITEAIILAGGLGTRIKDTLGDLPKSMADINGKPLLAYILDHLRSQGVNRAILAVGHKLDPIFEYFGSQYEGMTIDYSIEGTPIGTGGGIKQAFEMVDGSSAYVLNGDTYFPVPLQDLHEKHGKAGALISIALKEMKDFDRYATVQVDEGGRIVGYTEKQPTEVGNISGGIYIIEKAIFSGLPLGDKFSFETDLMEASYSDMPYFGFTFDTYFIDIGIPEDYQRAKDELAQLEH